MAGKKDRLNDVLGVLYGSRSAGHRSKEILGHVLCCQKLITTRPVGVIRYATAPLMAFVGSNRPHFTLLESIDQSWMQCLHIGTTRYRSMPCALSIQEIHTYIIHDWTRSAAAPRSCRAIFQASSVDPDTCNDAVRLPLAFSTSPRCRRPLRSSSSTRCFSTQSERAPLIFESPLNSWRARAEPPSKSFQPALMITGSCGTN